jgi:superfamily II helicase
MAAHFIGMERIRTIRDLVKEKEDPLEILTELEWREPPPTESPAGGKR